MLLKPFFKIKIVTINLALLSSCSAPIDQNPAVKGGLAELKQDTTENNKELTKSKTNSDFLLRAVSRGGLPVRMNHHINTTVDEYLPAFDPQNNTLYFTGMDRTGHFDFKIDYTKAPSSGGEDIFYSRNINGLYDDARPIKELNTNGHEAISFVSTNGWLLLSANYPEKLGVQSSDAGTETADIFIAKPKGAGFQILHLDEPVNSIYSEADAISNDQMDYILFVSDRPGGVGEYHKKGWLFSGSRWGNTDVYVTTKEGDYWSPPINLGNKINTIGAERTPWLSKDGLILFLSSNGYEKDKQDLDIYMFKRQDPDNWTEWEGPFKIKNACSELDDWGYKEYPNETWFARAIPLGFTPTQTGRSGDAGIRETNLRTGYSVTGAQIAALDAKNNTEIFRITPVNSPSILLPDILFKLNSFELDRTYNSDLERLTDFCKQNPAATIRIVGHTDNTGTEKFNQTLSEKRADKLRKYLLENGIKSAIRIEGKGSREPRFKNDTENGRKSNRRVELYFL